MTIELGEILTTDAPAEQARPRRRRVVVGAVVALLLGTLAGAIPGQRPALVVRWSADVDVSQLTLDDSGLYVGTADGRLVARDVSTGQVRWQASAGITPGRYLAVGAGVVGMMVDVSDATGTHDRAMLWRATSGEVIGVVPAFLVGPSRDGSRYLLQVHSDEACRCLAPATVDAGTGRTDVRSVPVGERAVWSMVDGAVEAYGIADAQGRLRIYDPGTGELVEEADVPGDPYRGSLALTPDRLFVTSGAGLTAYRRHPIAPLWTYHGGLSMRMTPCGWTICVGTDAGTLFLDQATGRLRFTTTDDMVGTVGDGVVLTTRTHPGTDELPPPWDLLILDPDTGQLRSIVPSAYPIAWSHSGGTTLLLQQQDRATTFIEVLANGQTRVLGHDRHPWMNCTAWSETLACGDGEGHLKVWTVA